MEDGAAWAAATRCLTLIRTHVFEAIVNGIAQNIQCRNCSSSRSRCIYPFINRRRTATQCQPIICRAVYIVCTVRISGIDEKRVLCKEIVTLTCAKVIISTTGCRIIAFCQLQQVIFESITIRTISIIICTCYCGIEVSLIRPKDIIAQRIRARIGVNPAAAAAADAACRIVIQRIIAQRIRAIFGINPAAAAAEEAACRIVIQCIIAQRIRAISDVNPAAKAVGARSDCRIVIQRIIAQRIRAIFGVNPAAKADGAAKDACRIVIQRIIAQRIIRAILDANPAA